MSFARLRAADWVAFIAALALLLVTAVDWYSTIQGEQAREFEQSAPTRGEDAQLQDDAALAPRPRSATPGRWTARSTA